MTWTQILDTHAHTVHFDMTKTSRNPLTEYRLIVAEGADAQKFLQGQCTCDFTHLQDDNFILGAHCTPKGRMHSSFVAAYLDNDNMIGLRVHASIAQSALAALQKYAVFSKVTLRVAEDYHILGITGEDSHAQLELIAPELRPTSTQQKRSATCDHNITALSHTPQQVELWCKGTQTLHNVNQQLQNTPLQSNDNLWRLFNIHNGVGNVQSETQESLLPQEINFQYIDGVSFKKGCYTGQEIVARLHYRGQMKKHMYRATLLTTQPPSLGMTLHSPDKPEKTRGSLINFAQASGDTYEALVLCDDTLFEHEAYLKHESLTAKIQWQALPYAIS